MQSSNSLSSHAKICILLLILLGYALGTAEFSVIGIESELADYYEIPVEQTGRLISAFSVAYAFCTPLLALTTGRFKRYHLLVAYIIVFTASNFASMLAPSFGALIASRILLGAVSGALLAVGVTFIPELVGIKRTTVYISYVYAAFSVAMVISTALGKMIAATIAWELVFVIVFVLCLAICIALIIVLPRTGTTDEPATIREQLPFLVDRRVLACMTIFIFGVGAVYTFYAYIAPYTETVLGMSAAGASMVMVLYGCACFVSNLLSGWADTRFGLRALVVSFAVQAILLATLSAVGPIEPGAVIVITLIALTMYVVSNPCISVFMSTSRTTYPQAGTLAASMEPMSFNIGIAFGTAVSGVVVRDLGMNMVGYIGSILSLCALAFTLIAIHLVKKANDARRKNLARSRS